MRDEAIAGDGSSGTAAGGTGNDSKDDSPETGPREIDSAAAGCTALNSAATVSTTIPSRAAHDHPARRQAFSLLFDPKLSLPKFSDARSFYIRFAKITLPETVWLFPGLRQRYNVFRYQALSSSTCEPGLASDL